MQALSKAFCSFMKKQSRQKTPLKSSKMQPGQRGREARELSILGARGLGGEDEVRLELRDSSQVPDEA